MNTHTNDHDPDTPEAVREARAGAKSWRTAVLSQRTAVPDHADFYAMTADVVDTLAAVAGLAEVLAWQVAHYGDTRPVYDDSRVVDPRERLDAAAMDLHELAACLRGADQVANTFWSRISHIGVDDATTDSTGSTNVAAEVAR
ncbi:MAG: hypothetical protein J0I34_33595 [Pseudonocardia sp.]|uniref:hypothetical protein n=1 Tax=unclassified Pseudonocardia TaxID=2619320 RepID=UPI00086D9983|nr:MULTISPECIES: hypothetical protein [unclassified Pseudonocardia]MBN9113696.1 hypothetical protein [Pseudonocardia sp.]ODU23389.1 MAG: hypothetical protein ABS80_15110 [Pseudonocardia sp. SCN 72-51]ODU98682.1 MAG: hypothetical protein ABT15_33110 [Pseudonocardia sp. SCN 73-27]